MEGAEEDGKDDKQGEESVFLKTLLEKMKKKINVEVLDAETTRMVERVVVMRVSTKHINLWMRQLAMKRREIIELAGLMGLEMVKKEIEEEKNLYRDSRSRNTH